MTDQTQETESKEEAGGFSLALLKNEIIWLILVAATLYFFLIFITFNRNDPGWSHASQVDSIANLGGRTGAWIADILLFIFGLSAWWIALPLIKGIWTGCKRIAAVLRNQEYPEPSLLRQISSMIGFALLMVSSSGIEYLRMYHTNAQLPNIPGGIVGDVIGQLSQQYLGFTCGTALLGLIAFISFSLCLQKSWIAIVECIGAIAEWPFLFFRHNRSEPVAPEQDNANLENTATAETDMSPSVEPLQASTVDDTAGTAIANPAPMAEAETPTSSEVLADNIESNDINTFPGHREPVLEKFQEPILENQQPVKPVIPQLEPEPLGFPADIHEKGAASSAPAAPVLKVQPVVTPVSEPVMVVPETVDPDSYPAVPALPPLSLLDPPEAQQESASPEALDYTSRLIERKLADFGVKVRVVSAFPGPVVTRYEIEPAVGVKGSSIVNLSRDLARSLSLVSIRVVENVPGKTYMALELPNTRRQIVHLSEILGSDEYNNASSNLTVALGKDITGKPVVADLARMPHLLIAGTTGSGKSVGINATILSLLYKATPEQVRLILIDPKMLELSIYQDIPHLLTPVVTVMEKAGHALNWAVSEMEKRYLLMSKIGVRNLAGYNKRIEDAEAKEQKIPNPFSLTPDAPEPLEKLPQIVIIIDEFSDLMMTVGKKVEQSIARIAQKARAAGIHLILATQRPSVDVITGLIKANVPTRIAFQVSSKVDSRTILDQTGAETLLGLGDMLYLPPGTGLPKRVHGAFVSDEEVTRVVDFLKQQGEPNYIDGILEGNTDEDGTEGDGYSSDDESDEKYDEAVAIVLKNKKASISLVQRHLRIGYNRAARLLEQMERSGLVSPMKSNGTRDVIVPTTSSESP
ncbi:MAG: DNA translocase FtsK 4TM domain-containing protein [Oxalobacter sp.]|nr:DNA translocase FtsK 4TM domain-containing protein [Oxalobacter sp.]